MGPPYSIAFSGNVSTIIDIESQTIWQHVLRTVDGRYIGISGPHLHQKHARARSDGPDERTAMKQDINRDE